MILLIYYFIFGVSSEIIIKTDGNIFKCGKDGASDPCC